MLVPANRDCKLDSVLTSTRTMSRNMVWSLLGFVTPLPIAIITVPYLTRALGPDRFGVLALILALVGYSSILDLGLGRALTKVVAGELASPATSLGSLVMTSLVMLAALGAIGAVLIFAVAPGALNHVIAVPAAIRGESLAALRVMAFSLPFVTMTTGVRGVLEAHAGYSDPWRRLTRSSVSRC